MGKFSSKPRLPPPVVLSAPTPTVEASKERGDTGADEAAKRLRLAEKRKRGRRSSILSNISSEEAQLATVERPAGRAASVLFGS